MRREVDRGRGRVFRPFQDLALGLLCLVTGAAVVLSLHSKPRPLNADLLTLPTQGATVWSAAPLATPTPGPGPGFRASLALRPATDSSQTKIAADSPKIETWGTVFGPPDTGGIRTSTDATRPLPPFGIRVSVTGTQADVILADAINAMVRLDGVPVRRQGLPSLTGAKQVLRVSWLPAGTHVIEVVAEGGGFGGVTVPTGATVNLAPTDSRKHVLFIGDEISTTIGAGPAWLAAGWAAAERAGMQPWLDGETQAGCTAKGVTGSSLASRLASDVAPANPDVIVVTCGARDATLGLDASTGLATLLDELGVKLPDARVIVVGPIASSAGATTAERKSRDQLRAAVAGRTSVQFIDPIGTNWSQTGGIGSAGVALSALGHAAITQKFLSLL